MSIFNDSRSRRFLIFRRLGGEDVRAREVSRHEGMNPKDFIQVLKTFRGLKIL